MIPYHFSFLIFFKIILSEFAHKDTLVKGTHEQNSLVNHGMFEVTKFYC